MNKEGRGCPRNHDARFGLIGARHGCLACQAEEMGEEIKVLKLKLARKQKRAETAIITVRCSKGLHQEIQLVAKPSMNQWCIAAFEKMLEENNEGSGQDQS